MYLFMLWIVLDEHQIHRYGHQHVIETSHILSQNDTMNKVNFDRILLINLNRVEVCHSPGSIIEVSWHSPQFGDSCRGNVLLARTQWGSHNWQQLLTNHIDETRWVDKINWSILVFTWKHYRYSKIVYRLLKCEIHLT